MHISGVILIKEASRSVTSTTRLLRSVTCVQTGMLTCYISHIVTELLTRSFTRAQLQMALGHVSIRFIIDVPLVERYTLSCTPRPDADSTTGRYGFPPTSQYPNIRPHTSSNPSSPSSARQGSSTRFGRHRPGEIRTKVSFRRGS